MPWADDEPVRGGYPPPEFIALPGIDRATAGTRGQFPPPPIHHLTGLTVGASSYGRSTFELPATPWLAGTTGVFPAGTAALVADAPLGSAILSTLPGGTYGVTSELSMSFLRPTSVASRALTARARLVDAGRSLGLSEATVEDAAGQVVAHATSRYFLLHVDPIPRAPNVQPVDAPAYDTPDPYLRPQPVPVPPEEAARYSGLELLRSMARGEMPLSPFARLLGIRPLGAEHGLVESAMRAREWLCSPARTIYGGILALFADVLVTGAVATTVPAGSSYATLDLKVYFLRPSFADGRDLTGRGTLVHRGRSIGVARAEIRNADDKPVVVATGSVMVRVGKPWLPVVAADEPANGGD